MIRWFIRADRTKVLQYKIEGLTFSALGNPVPETTWIDAHTEYEPSPEASCKHTWAKATSKSFVCTKCLIRDEK